MALTVCFHPMSHGLPFICIHWTLCLAHFLPFALWMVSYQPGVLLLFVMPTCLMYYFISIGLISGWRFVSCTGLTGLMDIMFRSLH
jgi:hypothetical protein